MADIQHVQEEAPTEDYQLMTDIFETTELTKFPAVGDFVMVSIEAGDASIHQCLSGFAVGGKCAVPLRRTGFL